jgi:hypothetical protein
VTVDGKDAGTVNLYSASTLWRQKVWNTGMLPSGTHTVTISWTGTAGAGGGTLIGVDAFDVIGTLTDAVPTSPTRYEQTDSRVLRTGVWRTYPKAAASGRSYNRSATTGASVTINFTGTRLDWVTMSGTTAGSANVYLDGTKVATITLNATSPTYNVVAWSSGPLANGKHTVRIERVSGTTLYLPLDAVDIWGTITI